MADYAALFAQFLDLSERLRIADDEREVWISRKIDESREETNRKEQRQEEREASRLKEEFERQREEAERQRRHELLLVQTKTDQLAAAKLAPKFPKLPVFDTKSDCIDAFLHRFETQAKLNGWPADHWCTALVNCLVGEPLQVFHTLPAEHQTDYDFFKKALLKRFRLTEEGYHHKFVHATPIGDENFDTFLNRTKQYLSRWLDLANVSSFEELFFLLVREQIYSACDVRLVDFLKERKPTNFDLLAELADNFASAHPNVPLGCATDARPTYAGSASVQAKGSARARSRSDVASNPSTSFTPRRNFRPTPCRSRAPAYDNNTVPTGSGSASKRKLQVQLPNKSTLTPPAVVCQFCDKLGHSAKSCFKIRNRHSASVAAVHMSPRAPVRTSDEFKPFSTVASDDVDSLLPCRGASPLQFTTDRQADNHSATSVLHALPTVSASAGLVLVHGSVNGYDCSVMRDTGCTTIGVRRSLINPARLTGRQVQCVTFGGNVEVYPTALVDIATPYISGTYEACVLPNPVSDLIIGNVPSVVDNPPNLRFWTHGTQDTCPVVTRANDQAKSFLKPLSATVLPQGFDHRTFKSDQQSDPSLSTCFTQVHKPHRGRVKFIIENGLLYRLFRKGSKSYNQLVVPSSFRSKLLALAHDSMTSGHLGSTSTIKRLTSRFYWPRITSDVRAYTRSCPVCQTRSHRGATPKVPLSFVPTVTTPFKRVAIDLVGPLVRTRSGCSHILVLTDYATRWVEAIPMKATTSPHVAEALLSIFCRLGFPDEIVSDNGPQFVSDVMEQVFKLLGIKHSCTTPYHPQANGLCERYNGTLKTMLRKVCADHPQEWDRYLPILLFAYREIEQESTSYSPFQLLFGRLPRGSLDIARRLCENSRTDDDVIMNSFEYIQDLQSRISKSVELAQDNVAHAATRHKLYADRGSKPRQFQVGDKVLLLLPQDKNKLLMEWKGPFSITAIRSGTNYELDIDSRNKVFHINMLQKYYERDPHVLAADNAQQAALGLVINDDDETLEGMTPSFPSFPHQIESQTEFLSDVHVNTELNRSQTTDLYSVLNEFQHVFTDVPGHTDLVEHHITLTDPKPIHVKPYPIPFAARDRVKEELTSMLNLGIVRFSTSPYSSPIVVVKKKDGNIRLCIDFRKLNSISLFDSEPIPNQDDLFTELSDSKFFTKIDLSKGYWQIPLSEDCKPFTAFQSPLGLLEFNVLPFGLSTAASTFQRMMRMLFPDFSGVISYFDDVLVHSATWQHHIATVRSVLSRLSDCHITARPAKSFFAFQQIEFLGHMVSQGFQYPEQGMLRKIAILSPPETKKQVRSILGTLNFYKKYVPHFSQLSAVLSDLTKKNMPNKVVWQDAHQRAFDAIKGVLNDSPFLRIPDPSRPFVVRTDASSRGIAGVLLQQVGHDLLPCAYASRKLSDAEQRYSVIERECLGIVFALHHFSRFLLLREFVLETDHKPLSFLSKQKLNNNRLMRWSLALQHFKFIPKHIPGSTNVLADMLSRLI